MPEQNRTSNDVVPGLEHEGHECHSTSSSTNDIHVAKPLLDQLAGLGWEVIDLTDKKQTPATTHRESFTEVVMPLVLRERRKVIN